jgi:hypothetical protein
MDRLSQEVEPMMRWGCLFAVVVVVVSLSFASNLLAQGLTTADLGDRKHHDPSGRVCLETTGAAQPLTSNTKIFTHIVTLENHCAEFIRARVCYHGSDTCTDVEVPARSRKEQMIGVLAMQQFRYDVKEQF